MQQQIIHCNCKTTHQQ